MSHPNLKTQRWISFLAVAIFLIKIIAWFLTKSVAIYTDALESLVNVVAGFLGLYSICLSLQPRDENHPYGHGKVEYLSAAIEGSLIIIAGIIIIIEAVQNIFHPNAVQEINSGLILIGITALLNGAFGYYAVQLGVKNKSIALKASGKHLLSDTYSTIGLILGLVLIKYINWPYLDSVLALVFAFLIIYNGYKVLRPSLAGIMDEANIDLLRSIIAYLDKNRAKDWIDLHNMRSIEYGSILHIDAHITLPWYYNVQEAHESIRKLEVMMKEKFATQVELFIHADACTPNSCAICALENCPVRQQAFEQKIDWTLNNVLKNKQHSSKK